MTGPASTTTSTPRRLTGGYLASAAIGLLLVYPLLISELLARQVVGSLLDAPWTPFGADRDGKTQLSVFVTVLVTVPLLLGALAVSRAVRRRLPAGRWVVVHYPASLVVVLLPFVVFRAGG